MYLEEFCIVAEILTMLSAKPVLSNLYLLPSSKEAQISSYSFFEIKKRKKSTIMEKATNTFIIFVDFLMF